MPIGFADVSQPNTTAKKDYAKAHKTVRFGSDEGREIMQALVLGEKPAAVAKQHGVRRALVLAIERHYQRMAASMAGESWAQELIQSSKEAVMMGTKDPSWYNPAKVAISALKGLGLFKTGDAQGPVVVNNQILVLQRVMNAPAAEQEKLLADYDREQRLLTSGAQPETSESAGMGARENSGEPAVVGA